MPPPRVVACPSSLKGVLSARAAAHALGEGLRRAGAEVDEAPIADGGEGTAEAIAAARGGVWRETEVSDPLGRPVHARWLLLPDGTAVVEAAEAIGHDRVAPAERDPLAASSRGVGELIAAALAERPAALLVCLGGSATVDGGTGLREVVTALPNGRVTVACDVRSPLLGESGAARAFGPQKGATPAQVEELERRLAALADLEPVRDLPGAGAAGGLGAALAALGARLVEGADLVLRVTGVPDRLAGASLAITGEGAVDRTTLLGKGPGAVVALCRARGVPCALFGGRVEVRPEGVDVHELSGRPERARDDLVELGERLGRSLAR